MRSTCRRSRFGLAKRLVCATASSGGLFHKKNESREASCRWPSGPGSASRYRKSDEQRIVAQAAMIDSVKSRPSAWLRSKIARYASASASSTGRRYMRFMKSRSSLRASSAASSGTSLTPPSSLYGMSPATAVKLAGGHSSCSGPSSSSQFSANPGTPSRVALALPLQPGRVRISRVASGRMISFFFRMTSHSETLGSGYES